MSDTPWTPGPWRVERPSHHAGMIEVAGSAMTACWAFTIATNVTAENAARMKADANLIAAAPDMAEALAEFIAIDEDPDPTPQDRIDAAFAAARAVLVKARGQA